MAWVAWILSMEVSLMLIHAHNDQEGVIPILMQVRATRSEVSLMECSSLSGEGAPTVGEPEILELFQSFYNCSWA